LKNWSLQTQNYSPTADEVLEQVEEGRHQIQLLSNSMISPFRNLANLNIILNSMIVFGFFHSDVLSGSRILLLQTFPMPIRRIHHNSEIKHNSRSRISYSDILTDVVENFALSGCDRQQTQNLVTIRRLLSAPTKNR
jgi:hypothetical protein